uniref:Akirin 1 n=1 Tax=Leptobrachium leishanense TaxID=445787 RepID=A0A8C5MQS6_9ANUR
MACGATLKRSMEFEALSPQSPKRRRCVPLPMSPATPINQRCGLRPESQPVQPPAALPQLRTDRRLTTEQIFQNLKEGYTRYQRQRHLEGTFSHPEAGTSQEVQGNYSFTAPASPGFLGKKDQPTFSLRQVGALCERLLKDHEDKIREEYEQILNTKLAEQYESFVKFTQDQIMRRYGTRPTSYVS